MVHLYSAVRAEPLAKELAEVLIREPGDPMDPLWIAVPTEGMRRWMVLELARYLGATGGGHADGVAANVARAFPGTLRAKVLEAAGDGQPDPWGIDRMVWPLLDLYDGLESRGREPAFTRLAGGASRFTRVRTVADLFDRYHLHRPEMVRAWGRGEAVDGSGQELQPQLAWQQRVWSQLGGRIGVPSPPERMPGLLADVRGGRLVPDVPDRLVFFGFTTLPGREFLDLLDAVAVGREVHLFLLWPSRLDGGRHADAWPHPGDGRPRLRIDDPTAPLVRQPLLRTWGRVARETALLLADAPTAVVGTPEWVDVPEPGPGPVDTLLARLQHDIRHDTVSPPEGVDYEDGSIRFHACFGPMRQAEVARDAVLHVLAADPTLEQEDVLIVCPGLDRFAPLVEAAFGAATAEVGTPGPPGLRFQIADRSIRAANPVVGAVMRLVDMLGSRFEAAPVVDFLSCAPVRLRFGLDDDALGVVTDWVARTQVRWGLDAVHRTGFDMPTAVDGNTWQAALDRLLLGATMLDDRLALGVGGVAPMAVDSGDTGTLGSLATVLTLLAELTAWANAGRHALVEWIDRIEGAGRDLLAAPSASTWQFDALHRVLAELVESSGPADGGAGHLVDLRDVGRILEGRLGSEAGRPDFFRGGVTVTSMTPLRGVPFRVVCILGFDQEFLGAPASDAADLVAASPQVGDPDRRIEWRQSLLDTVLSAGDHLIVVRDGHDIRTSQEVPRAIAAAELFDAVVNLAREDQRHALRARLEVQHPRHGFDIACLEPDALLEGTIWSFDPSDLARAGARRSARTGPRPPARPLVEVDRTEAIDLADLRSFLMDPVSAFAGSTVQMALPGRRDVDDVILPVAPGPLEASALGRRLLAARWGGATTEAWLEVERRAGTLPPGTLEEQAIGPLRSEVDALVVEAVRRGVRMGEPDYLDVEVTLEGGPAIVGTIPLLLPDETPGPAWVRFTRSRPTFTLDAWLHLMMLVASAPDRPWRSVFLSRGTGDDPVAAVDLVLPAPPEERLAAARRALGVVVACYRAGMREPLPLFPTFSLSVAQGAPDFSAWSGQDGRGDRAAPATAFFYGRMNGSDLLALDPVEGDPPGPGGRVQRWADYLWGAVAATSLESGR